VLVPSMSTMSPRVLGASLKCRLPGHHPAVGQLRHMGWEPADSRFGAALT